MHDFLINASIQLVPLTQDRHPYHWVDEAIAVIRQSGIRYEVGAFATVVEGRYNEVMEVINAVNSHLVAKGCTEWITAVQLQLRSNGDVTGEEKTRNYR